jgi:hypothetical protein
MAGKKQQPQISEMLSVLFEQIEVNKLVSNELKTISEKLNLRMDRIQNLNPKLNSDTLKNELETFKKSIDSQTKELTRIFTIHINYFEKEKQELLDVKLTEEEIWYLDYRIWIIIGLSIFSVLISYKFYKINIKTYEILLQIKSNNNTHI